MLTALVAAPNAKPLPVPLPLSGSVGAGRSAALKLKPPLSVAVVAVVVVVVVGALATPNKIPPPLSVGGAGGFTAPNLKMALAPFGAGVVAIAAVGIAVDVVVDDGSVAASGGSVAASSGNNVFAAGGGGGSGGCGAGGDDEDDVAAGGVVAASWGGGGGVDVFVGGDGRRGLRTTGGSNVKSAVGTAALERKPPISGILTGSGFT